MARRRNQKRLGNVNNDILKNTVPRYGTGRYGYSRYHIFRSMQVCPNYKPFYILIANEKRVVKNNNIIKSGLPSFLAFQHT